MSWTGFLIVLVAILASSPEFDPWPRPAFATAVSVPPAPVLTQTQTQTPTPKEINVSNSNAKTEAIEAIDATGNLLEAPIDPVLEPLERDRYLDVVVNMRLARHPHGEHAIKVYNMPPDGCITAAEAAELKVQLELASDTVARIRGPLGYDS